MKDMKGYFGVSILHALHVLHGKTKKGGFYEKSPPLEYQLNIADKGF